MKQLFKHIECQDLYAKFYFDFFLHFKLGLKQIFKNWEHILPGAKTSHKVNFILG
jgi:hypothetical protein